MIRFRSIFDQKARVSDKNRIVFALFCVVFAVPPPVFADEVTPPRPGRWNAWLEAQGGHVGFEIELNRKDSEWEAEVLNGTQVIKVPIVSLDGTNLTLEWDDYDSRIVAEISGEGDRLEGEWKKKGRRDGWTTLPFHAISKEIWRIDCGLWRTVEPKPFLGRWQVHFSESDQPAVAVFGQERAGIRMTNVAGTFLTVGGDYGHLAGFGDGQSLSISTFDGSHAFRIEAKLQQDGTLKGDFWSGPSWHETWTATKNENAKLPDAFSLTKATGRVDLAAMKFPDVDGKVHSLADPEFKGEAIVIEVFGSWCPNCHDASAVLMELYKKYADRGLSMVGLAFELTGDVERDSRQLRTYVKRHGIIYPVLLAGVADKETVAKVLPFLEKFNAYPTTIFLDGEGNVRAIHTGFSGPATGQEYHSLKLAFESKIGELLTEKKHIEREKRVDPE